MNNNIVLNLLVFAKKVEKGTAQQDLIVEASELGFDKVEVRREYFKNLKKELPMIKKIATDMNVEIFYSVPEGIFVNKKFNSNVKTHIKEAKLMGASHIKWNIGDYTSGTPLEELKEMTATSSIEFNIENDQTESAGMISPILKFMKDMQKEKISIGFVYDLGNWRFVEENEIEAAKQLRDFVRIIHMKDIAYLDGKPQTTKLDEGEINWREVLKILPTELPIAIEYATFSDQEILKAKETLKEAQWNLEIILLTVAVVFEETCFKVFIGWGLSLAGYNEVMSIADQAAGVGMNVKNLAALFLLLGGLIIFIAMRYVYNLDEDKMQRIQDKLALRDSTK